METKSVFESMPGADKVELAQALYETAKTFLTTKGHLTPNTSAVETGIEVAKVLCQAASLACPFINGLS